MDLALEERQEAQVLLEPGFARLLEPGRQDEEAPEAENDTGDRCQEVREERQWLAQCARAEINQENGHTDAAGDRAVHGKGGGLARSEDCREDAKDVMHRIKRQIRQKTEAELLDGRP